MKIRELDYMGDAYIEVIGADISECFRGAALGLLRLIYNVRKVNPKNKLKIELEGTDLHNLLYRWLEFFIIKISAERMAFGEINVRVDPEAHLLSAELGWEPYSPKKHGFRTEVKGITYHLMEIQIDKGCRLRYLADL